MRIDLKARILPAFGRMPLERIGPADVAAWFDAASRGKPGAANRAFEILRAMMIGAEEWGLRERGTNPCLGIARNPGTTSPGSSTPTSWRSRAPDAQWPEAVAAVRLLALTGWRRGEVLNLRWRDIGEAARSHIGALPRKRRPDRFPFPKLAEGRYSHSLIMYWRAVCADARLGKLRLHDLRHLSAASEAVMSGEGLSLVGKLLGHRRHRTTAGHAHLAEGHLVEAAEEVRGVIAAAMGSSTDAPKGSSGVRPCAVEPADDRLHYRPARRVIARRRT